MNILKVENLKKYYGKNLILNNINFKINESEIVGFIGPNGAGKSTTMKCISGLTNFSDGSIHIVGKDIKKDNIDALSLQTSLIEGPGLFDELTGRQNIHLFAKLRNIDNHQIEKIIKLINLEKHIDKKVSKYSMGMKQRIAIAIALLPKPKLIMLDEPTNGLDPSGIIELLDFLKDIVIQNECSILFSSHTLSDVEKIADRIIFIKDGSIISSDKINKLSKGQIYEIEVNNAISHILTGLQLKYTESKIKNNYIIEIPTPGELNSLLEALIENKLIIRKISLKEKHIEDIYKELYYE